MTDGIKQNIVREMNQDHPAFDLDMEILCTIPAGSGFVTFNDMKADFGLLTHKPLDEALERLHVIRQIKLQITWEHPQDERKGPRIVRLVGDTRRAILIGERYWRQVYGNSTHELPES